MKVLLLPRYGIQSQICRQRALRFLPALAQNHYKTKVLPLFPKATLEAKPTPIQGIYRNLNRFFKCLSNRDHDLAWVEGSATPLLPSWLERLACRSLPKLVLCDLMATEGIPPACYHKKKTAFLTAPHLHSGTRQIKNTFVLPPLPWPNQAGEPTPLKSSKTPVVFVFKAEAHTRSPLDNALTFVAKRHSFKHVQHLVTWEALRFLETSTPEDNPVLSILEGCQPSYLADTLFLGYLDKAIPVLADSRAVSPWLLKRGRGFCTADDEQGWILALDKTLANPDFRQVLGQDGKDWMVRHMSHSVYEAKLLAFLEKFVNGE